MKLELKRVIPMAEAFSRLLHPFAEVVIHDLKKDQVVAIFNPCSKRKVGDRSYLDRWDFSVSPEEDVIGPYEKTNYDGRKLKSISVILRDQKGNAKGFLCVNVDISVFEYYQSILLSFLGNNDSHLSKKTQPLFKDDLYEKINVFIQEYCRSQQLSLENLSRDDKRALVINLEEKGAFNGKNASSYVARILNVSRATVYNYLNNSN